MKQIAVYGAGGFGKEVAMLIEQINQNALEWQIVGFFDDAIAKGTIINGYPVLGGISEVNAWPKDLAVSIAIGNCQTRSEIRNKIANPAISFPSLIHPTVLMGSFVEIAEGAIITARCILTVNIEVGAFTILNLACTIGHDSKLGNFVSLMPGVNVSGAVILQDSAYIGTGAQILNKAVVGRNAIVGAGAVVTESIAPDTVVVGVPAKAIKHTE